MFHGWKQQLFGLLCILGLQGFSLVTMAEDDLDLDSIEAEMTQRGEKEAQEVAPSEEVREEFKPQKIKLKEINELTAFSDLAVIQKKYMPKTNRMQFYGGIDFLANNPFFDSFGFNGRASFFFTESFGIELNYWKHSPSRRSVATELESKHNITTKTLLSSLSFKGASLVLVPFYGKVSLLDRRIIPFDFYFSLGGGLTETSYLDKEAKSLHVGLGQIFSINKSVAWRWDLSHVSYKARTPNIDGSDSGVEQEMKDLYLGIGMTVLFPGVKYR